MNEKAILSKARELFRWDLAADYEREFIEFARWAAEVEREACAKECEGACARPNPYANPDNARFFADAIRARGEK